MWRISFVSCYTTVENQCFPVLIKINNKWGFKNNPASDAFTCYSILSVMIYFDLSYEEQCLYEWWYVNTVCIFLMFNRLCSIVLLYSSWEWCYIMCVRRKERFCFIQILLIVAHKVWPSTSVTPNIFNPGRCGKKLITHFIVETVVSILRKRI